MCHPPCKRLATASYKRPEHALVPSFGSMPQLAILGCHTQCENNAWLQQFCWRQGCLMTLGRLAPAFAELRASGFRFAEVMFSLQ